MRKFFLFGFVSLLSSFSFASQLSLTGGGTTGGTSVSFDPSTLSGLKFWGPAAPTGSGGSLTQPNTYQGTLTNGPTWTNDFPTQLTGIVTGSINFLDASSQSVVHTGITFPTFNGLGYLKQQVGPGATLSLWVKLNAIHGAGAYRGLWLDAGANSFYIHGGKLSYYSSGDHDSATSLTSGSWHHIGLRVVGGNPITNTSTMEYWIDGVKDANTFNNLTFFTLTDIGGLHTATAYGVDGKIAYPLYFDVALSTADMVLLSNGGTPAWRPKAKFRFDEQSGTTTADLAQVFSSGTVVGTISDISGAGNHVTQATASKKPVYKATSPYEVEPIPVMGSSVTLRFDPTQSQEMSKSGVLGAAETDISAQFAGRVFDADRNVSNYFQNHWIWGASKSGSFSTATASTDEWLAVGYEVGGSKSQTGGQDNRIWAFRAELKKSGSAVVIATATVPMHVFPITIGLRYHASTYLELWVNGVMVSSTGTNVPASLNLSNLFEISPSSAVCGWDYYDGLVGNANWSTTQMAQIHSYWNVASKITIPSVTKSVLFDGGGYDGSGVTGFNLGTCLFKSTTTGTYHCFWNTNNSDPGSQFTVMYSSSANSGVTWTTGTIIQYAGPGSGAYAFGGSAFERSDGRLMVFTSTSANVGHSSWTAFNYYSTDQGGHWTGPILISTPTGVRFWAPCGRPYEMPDGKIWMTWYGVKIGDTDDDLHYTCFLATSTDGGNTWGVNSFLSSASGLPNTYTVEPTLIFTSTDATQPMVYMRSLASSGYLTRSLDTGVTWSQAQHLSATATGPTQAQPFLYKAQNGDILLFLTIRRRAGETNDPGLRWGTIVIRSQDGGVTWPQGPTPIELQMDGWGYPSAFYMGSNRVGIATSDDYIHEVFTELDESSIP